MYLGFCDAVRTLFAQTAESRRRGYTASTFRFNVKGGHCEECAGEGSITTQLSFMPDAEVVCPTCKGARHGQGMLEVFSRDKNIADVLEMTIEDESSPESGCQRTEEMAIRLSCQRLTLRISSANGIRNGNYS